MADDCETCDPVDMSGLSDEDFAAFCDLKSEEGRLPAGRIEYVSGKVIFIDGNGRPLTVEEYTQMHGFDPAPVWLRIQAWRATHGKLMDPVIVGLSKPRRQHVKLGRQ